MPLPSARWRISLLKGWMGIKFSCEACSDIIPAHHGPRNLSRREHLSQPGSRRPVDPARAETLVQQFLSACRNGDVGSLMVVLAEDSTLWSDGGGRVRAALRPIHGAERIARFLFGIQKNIPVDAEFRLEDFNGGMGILIVSAGVPISVVTFNVIARQIAGIYIVGNPQKLRHLNHP
jgi:RNA polymerase sigma-70 factor, ECF subfamily